MNNPEVTKLNIMEWNIHQQGLYNNNTKSYDENTPLPMWIIDEFEDREIVVLTEYCHRNSNSGEFVKRIHEKGYNCVFSKNTIGNDVLIAIKKTYQIENTMFVSCGGINGIPENLRVDIKVKNDTLSVIGVRIKDFSIKRKHPIQEDYQNQAIKRAENMKWLMRWVENIQNPVVIMGDFNNYKVATTLKEWNLRVIDNMSRGFTRKTPEGSSVYKFNNDPVFQEDHFLIKGLKLNELGLKYDRDFVKHEDTVYQNGKNLEHIRIGYPDHAILKGNVEI